MIDPWGGYNQGMNNLNDTFVNIRQQDRQAARDQLAADAARQQLAMGAVALRDAQLQQDDRLSLRAKLAGAQPTTTTAITPAADPQQTPSQMLGVGVAPGAQYLNNIPASSNSPVGPNGPEMQPNTPPQSTTPAYDNSPPPASPTVQAYNEGRVSSTTTEPNFYRTIIDHARETGNVDLMNKTIAEVQQHAKSVMDITGNPMDGLKMVNSAIGSNLSLLKMPSFQILKNGDEPVGIIDEGTMKQDMMNGMSLSDATKKNMTPMQMGGGGKVVADFLAQNPKATAQQIWGLASKNNIPIKTVEPIITELQKAQHDADLNDRQISAQAHSDEMQRRSMEHSDALQRSAQAHTDAILARKAPGGNLSINGLTDSDAAILQKGVESGQIDASKISSRTAKIYVQMLKSNPNLDINNSAATSAALKKVVVQQAQTETFAKTANKNFDLVEKLYNQNPQSTVMLLNKLKNNINANIVGDPQTVMLGRALKTSLMEYAKVVTGSTGGAAATDSAQREVATLLSQADNPNTFHGSIANHRLEMQNRMEGFQETANTLKQGNGANNRQQIANTSAPQPIVQYFQQNATKYAQAQMIQQLKAKNWTDAQIGQAWAQYKRGGK